MVVLCCGWKASFWSSVGRGASMAGRVCEKESEKAREKERQRERKRKRERERMRESDRATERERATMARESGRHHSDPAWVS